MLTNRKTEPESVLQSVREQPNPSLQASMPVYDEDSYLTVQRQAENHLKHWLKKRLLTEKKKRKSNSCDGYQQGTKRQYRIQG